MWWLHPDGSYTPQPFFFSANKEKIQWKRDQVLRTGKSITGYCQIKFSIINYVNVPITSKIYLLSLTGWFLTKGNLLRANLPIYPILPSSKARRWTGNVSFSQSIMLHLWCSFMVTLCPCSMYVPPTGCCPSQTDPVWATYRLQLPEALFQFSSLLWGSCFRSCSSTVPTGSRFASPSALWATLLQLQLWTRACSCEGSSWLFPGHIRLFSRGLHHGLHSWSFLNHAPPLASSSIA